MGVIPMRKDRLDRATEVVVDAVEARAAEEGIDEALASNVAHDMAAQDEVLVALCERYDAVASTARRLNQLRDDHLARGDEVGNRTLAAGHALDDAVEARVEEVVDEAVEQAREFAIEESTEVKA